MSQKKSGQDALKAEGQQLLNIGGNAKKNGWPVRRLLEFRAVGMVKRIRMNLLPICPRTCPRL